MAFALNPPDQRNSNNSKISSSLRTEEILMEDLGWDPSYDPFWPSNHQNEFIAPTYPNPMVKTESTVELEDDSWWYSDAYTPDSKYEEWYLTYCHQHRKPRARRFVGVFNASHHNSTEKQNFSEMPKIRERCGDDDEGDFYTPVDESSMSSNNSVKSFIYSSSHEEDSDQNEVAESKEQLFLQNSKGESFLDLEFENRGPIQAPPTRTRPTLNFCNVTSPTIADKSSCPKENSPDKKYPASSGCIDNFLPDMRYDSHPPSHQKFQLGSGQQDKFIPSYNSPYIGSNLSNSSTTNGSTEFLPYFGPYSPFGSNNYMCPPNFKSVCYARARNKFLESRQKKNNGGGTLSHFKFSSGASLVIPTISDESHTYQLGAGPIENTVEDSGSGSLVSASARAALNRNSQYYQLAFDFQKSRRDNKSYDDKGNDPINWEEIEVEKISSVQKTTLLDTMPIESQEGLEFEMQREFPSELVESSPIVPIISENKVEKIEETHNSEVLPTKPVPPLTQLFPKNSPVLISSNSVTQIDAMDSTEERPMNLEDRLNTFPVIHSVNKRIQSAPTTVFSNANRHDSETKKILNLVWSNSQIEMQKEKSRSKVSALPKATPSQKSVEDGHGQVKKSVSFAPTLETQSSSAIPKKSIKKSCIPVPISKSNAGSSKLIPKCEKVSKIPQSISKPQPHYQLRCTPKSSRIPVSSSSSAKNVYRGKLPQRNFYTSYKILAQRKSLALGNSAHEALGEVDIQQNPRTKTV